MYIFTLYRTSVIILTPPPLHPHIHSVVKLCRKGVSQTKREAFFKKMCFQNFLERGERWRAADVCRKRVPDFSCLKMERSVSSRFEVIPNNYVYLTSYLKYLVVKSDFNVMPTEIVLLLLLLLLTPSLACR